MPIRRRPVPWMFCLLILPLGIIVGFKATPLPLLLAKSGMSVDRIARISSIVNLPGFLLFLWAPLADSKFRRRTWLSVGILGVALSVCLYFPLIGAEHVKLMTTLILIGGVAEALIVGACGGLMVRGLSATDLSKTSAWWQAGWLGGGALGGAAIVWMSERLPISSVGFCLAIVIALPGFLPFALLEPEPAPSPKFRRRFAEIGREIWGVIRTPKRRWSAVLLLAPGGTGAAMFLLPAIASHYGVTSTGVTWINGVAGGILMATGSLCGTLIPGDWDRRLMYAIAGAMNASAAILLLLSSRLFVYLVGTALYLLTNGFCAVWFTALIAEIIGHDARDSSTLFCVLNSVGSVSVIYMIWCDGIGYRYFGTRGLLWTDAAGSLLVCAIVFSVFAICGLGLRRGPRPAIHSYEPTM